MSKYRVQITQYSDNAKPRTVVEERYTEIVEAESAKQAKYLVTQWGANPRNVAEYARTVDVDIEVPGEADPSEAVTLPPEPCEECGEYCGGATEVWRTREDNNERA